MLEAKIINKKETIRIKSKDITAMLSEREDFISVQDISKDVKETNIMAFDCQLDDSMFSVEEINELLEELGEEGKVDEIQILFDDVRAFVKDITDEIESDLREQYLNDDIRCFFDVYSIDDTFTDFKLVFVISFKEISIASLTSLTNILGKKQLNGNSKFYS
ncbi:hypothetical protein GCM10008904_21120 [Paraclostridium ghonii]|uniref:Uncharacterized protein n=1 Tax=Paraclostridium ghonii TaxID=29358 RepID=A0ABU0N020_9FIRM|nr:hypothetical protein [Paeniclostridium ghonii]MDQ0556503.1 hypothetical protein [Paeniclostridium ghonii]